MLIKSFEGFRPRALPGSDGGWVIGYGHRASAREGASVSEAEAELLLQYDLIPIQAALSGGVTRAINQHQYDALASFAFSVGADAFAVSDVLQRTNAGEDADAAEALASWPERPARDAGLRRRAAERALFIADPARPVALAELLAAPVPAVIPEAVAETVPAIEGEDAPAGTTAAPETTDSATSWTDTAPITPTFSARYMAYAAPTFGPLPGAEADAGTPAAVPTAPEGVTSDAPVDEVASEPAVDAVADIEAEGFATTEPEATAGEARAEAAPVELSTEPPEDTPAALVADAGAEDAAPEEVSTDDGSLESETETEAAGDVEPAHPVAAELITEPAPVLVEPAAFDAAQTDIETATAPIEAATEVVVPFAPAAAPAEWTPPAVQPTLVFAEPNPDDPFAHAPLTSPPPSPAPLVWPALNEDLGGPVDAASLATPRLVWPREDAAAADAAPLFEDAGELNLSGSTLAWNDGFDPKTTVFSWRRVWAYLVMGGFGLVSLAVSMAALRKASLANTDVTSILAIAGVLALIGAACVGVSAYNIYQRITDDR